MITYILEYDNNFLYTNLTKDYDYILDCLNGYYTYNYT
jgi:hypothetical protein